MSVNSLTHLPLKDEACYVWTKFSNFLLTEYGINRVCDS